MNDSLSSIIIISQMKMLNIFQYDLGLFEEKEKRIKVTKSNWKMTQANETMLQISVLKRQ